MTVTEALLKRSTVRGFLKKPVPQETIKEIINIARQAPSNSNTQPWHIAVVSGKARYDMEQEIMEGLKAGTLKPHSAFPAGGMGLKGEYKQRQYDCAYKYYGSMGVDREDKAGRQRLLLKNWQFFGAPHGAFISMPETMHRANALDIGIFLQTMMLLFVERGIDSCPQGALAAFPTIVRKYVHVPDGNAIMCGLSFGYKEEGAQINSAKMDRVPLDKMASFAE